MTLASNSNRLESTSRPQSRKLPTNSSAAPRKRRKRTVASGASDDCFTCAKRSTRCDRRRPYCSQCLDSGRECAGYKTTLTWGVGVASRGKLRGLSLPVTGAQPTASSKSWPSPSTDPPPEPVASSSLPRSIPLIAADATPLESTPPSVAPYQQPFQQLSPASDTVQNVMPWPRGMPLAPEVWSSTSMYSPAAYSPSSVTQIDFGESPAANTPPYFTVGTEAVSQAPMAAQWPGPEAQEPRDHDNSFSWAQFPSPSYSQMLLSRSVGHTPRLRYLISYYAEVIAPMIVAFDSPTNPFRAQILHLARDSESLQEAIATLSTSNLRQRQARKTMSTERTPASRMSCMAHRALTRDDLGNHSASEIAQEEQYHRGRAVRALNAELADPQQRLSDSVLATLLILCLFHVCDTGVAQFKTQFAGVTKLLAIRMRASGRVTDDLKWFIRIFTWFDTMTATTNDRESHLRGTCLDITSLSDGDWGLEQLAGCDASLFRLVAQLGRLNLLSQHRTPRGPAPPEMSVPTTTLPPSMIHPQGVFVVPCGVPGAVDLNGFPTATPPQVNVPSPWPTSPAFWTEWYSLRQKLEAWRYLPHGSGTRPAPPYISPPSSPSSLSTVASQHYEEIFHVSESFRHAAILYSERLAYPDLPSSHPRIQNIVQVAMHHLTAVQSDAYLLWPLFITGSECVLESERSLIRQRCRDISRDSGFCNNLSCLDLLEKIWAQNATTDGYGNWRAPSGALAFERGFRWQQAMRSKRADAEYMVV